MLYISRLSNKGNNILCADYTSDINKALKLPLDFVLYIQNNEKYQCLIIQNKLVLKIKE